VTRIVNGRHVPEDEYDFKNWEADKLMHEVMKQKAENAKDMPAFWERQKAALRTKDESATLDNQAVK
jgi:hypothetical protein